MYMIAEVSQYVAVASFAEAWIEIIHKKKQQKFRVASFAEAWIEIQILYLIYNFLPSPPSRRRGLKSSSIILMSSMYMSPPSRRRGLK